MEDCAIIAILTVFC